MTRASGHNTSMLYTGYQFVYKESSLTKINNDGVDTLIVAVHLQLGTALCRPPAYLCIHCEAEVAD